MQILKERKKRIIKKRNLEDNRLTKRKKYNIMQHTKRKRRQLFGQETYIIHIMINEQHKQLCCLFHAI